MAPWASCFLNGVKLKHVFTADEERGEVFRWKEGPDGKPFRDPENPEVLATEMLTGRVEIVISKERGR